MSIALEDVRLVLEKKNVERIQSKNTFRWLKKLIQILILIGEFNRNSFKIFYQVELYAKQCYFQFFFFSLNFFRE